MAMSRLTPEEQAEQDLQRWRQGGLTPAASRTQTSLLPATGWQSLVAPMDGDGAAPEEQAQRASPPGMSGGSTEKLPERNRSSWQPAGGLASQEYWPVTPTVSNSFGGGPRPGTTQPLLLTQAGNLRRTSGSSTTQGAATDAAANLPRKPVRTEKQGGSHRRAGDTPPAAPGSLKSTVTPEELEITPSLGVAPLATRVYGGGVEVVYDPFERREIRHRYFAEHARDFLPSVFGGDTLPALRETREIYRQAQLRGQLPLAPTLSPDPQRQAGQVKLLRDLQDLLGQYSRQVVRPQWAQAVAQLPPDRATLATTTNPRLGGRTDAHPDPARYVSVGERLRLEQQVTGQLVTQFNPEAFLGWLAGRKQALHPYQRQALGNLLGWKQIEWLRGAELGRTMGAAAFTNVFAEALGGPLSGYLLGPALSRLGAGGRELLKRGGRETAAAGIERFGTTNAGTIARELHQGGVKVGSFGAVQQPALRVLSGETADELRRSKDKPRAVAQEAGKLTGLAGLGFGMGYATGVPLRGLGLGLGAGLNRVTQAAGEHPTLGRLIKAYQRLYEAGPTDGSAPTEPDVSLNPTLPNELKSPEHAATVYRAITGKFEAVDPERFQQQFSKNRASESLTTYSAEELATQRLFKLAGAEIYYGLKPIKNHPVTAKPELDIVSVMNNESGAPGVATPAVLLHAIENGATTLDAWDVHGYLPDRYQRFGFQEIGRSAYDVQQYGEPSAALKSAWRTMGWREGEPYPDVVFMKYGGKDGRLAPRPEEARGIYLRTGSLDPRRIHAATSGEISGIRERNVLSTGTTGPPGVRGSEGADAGASVRPGAERPAHVLTEDAFTRQYRALQTLSDAQLRALGIAPEAVRTPARATRPGEAPPAGSQLPFAPLGPGDRRDRQRRLPEVAEEFPAALSSGVRVEYRTRDGKLKLGRIESRNADGTYRLSNGIAAAPADRLRLLDPPPGAGRGLTPRPTPERPRLVVGTAVEYRRSSGTVRRSVIVSVNRDGTYQLRNGIARANPNGLRVLGSSAAPSPP